MKDKVVCPFISISIALPLLGLLSSSHFWPQTPLCYHLLCSSLYLFASSEAVGSAAKIPASRFATGRVGWYFLFSGYAVFPWFPSVSSLANAVLCCLSASGHPQRPCSVLLFLDFTGCELFPRAIFSFIYVFLFCVVYFSIVLC